MKNHNDEVSVRNFGTSGESGSAASENIWNGFSLFNWDSFDGCKETITTGNLDMRVDENEVSNS